MSGFYLDVLNFFTPFTDFVILIYYQFHTLERILINLESTFQHRVEGWSFETFGERIASNKLIRADRSLEEHLEMLQAADYPKKRILELVEYTYSRPKGDLAKEVGGAMVTMAAFCSSHGIDMYQCAEEELARIMEPEMIAKIKLKQATKLEQIPDSPLPQVVESTSIEVTPELVEEIIKKAHESYMEHYVAIRGQQGSIWDDEITHVIQETINKLTRPNLKG